MTAFSTLNEAVYQAIYNDLPKLYPGMEHMAFTNEDIEVHHFKQMWTSTATGFADKVAGRAMTEAYTTVVIHENIAVVYFNGLIAYSTLVGDKFNMDITNHDMEPQTTAVSCYGEGTLIISPEYEG